MSKCSKNIEERSKSLNNAATATTATTTKRSQLNIILSSAHGWIFFSFSTIHVVKNERISFLPYTLIPKSTSDHNAVYQSFFIVLHIERRAHIENGKRSSSNKNEAG